MSRNEWLLAPAVMVLAVACGAEDRSSERAETTPATADEAGQSREPEAAGDAAREAPAEAQEIAPGLSMRILEEGSGRTAEPGQTAVVNYTGWLYDPSLPDHRGKQFDSSVGRGPFEFSLGAGDVISGWDQGVPGMRVGEVRELTIAPELAYGERGAGPIPPGSTLVFEVELLDLK
ncbi:MAG TPA: FKBP-type peptidyl-prolyl cis-trans isomerase [Woeseiaceae bacterium]|jgi:FKBP-type peptidyl-prolyl cis-trans isomerase FkpA|nr:FKBP-type peptidyl-prolyl cis-trans isomerase [Woeseiaceae bacterium]